MEDNRWYVRSAFQTENDWALSWSLILLFPCPLLPKSVFQPILLRTASPSVSRSSVSQLDRPSFSGLPFALSPVQSPRFPISCFLYGTAPPNADPSPLSSPPQLSLRCTRGRGWTWGRRDAEAVAGSGRWSLPASPQPARGPAQVRGGALARPHPRGRRSRDSGLILSR